MGQAFYQEEPGVLAAQIRAEVQALPVQNTPGVRSIRRKYSRQLRSARPAFILALAKELIDTYGYRGLPYELIQGHRATFESLGEDEVEVLGRGINSWWSVDSYARLISGPAWLNGQISDELIHRWAHSKDRWWRRAALVSTVALNIKSSGGRGDALRTLAVCRMLMADRDDMVVKAMSWALRSLVSHDPEAARAFLNDHEALLAARVKREVRNKLMTGLKNPGFKKPGFKNPRKKKG